MPPTDDDVKAARESTADAYHFFRAQMEYGNPGGMTDILEIITSRMSVVISAARERGASDEHERSSLTASEWDMLDRVFMPMNPNKLRKAHPEVVALAKKVKGIAAAIRARADK